jgi:uncharacterized damage-inducible protein DinB
VQLVNDLLLNFRQMSDLPPLPQPRLGRYRHYKGGEYEIIGIARHSETLEPLVLYRPLYNATGLWVRPYAMFFGQVEHDGLSQPRFAPLEETCAGAMDYQFLIDTYKTERFKVVSVWSMFHDEDLAFRPHASDKRGRSVREQMVHQCMSEDAWFRTMFGIDADATPLPAQETRIAFIEKYKVDSEKRLDTLSKQPAPWWEEVVPFFNERRSRAWIMVRRIAHTAHHRGQQTALLRMLGRELYSTYGPTADTGGLPKNGAPTLYAYAGEDALIAGERAGGQKAALPEQPKPPVSERPA